MVIAFLGRMVMEKGLDVFADAIHAFATARAQASRAGDRRRPGAALVRGAAAGGDLHSAQQTGDDLARALASADVFLNPSITEAFGNVTLEAMACALAGASRPNRTGATNLVRSRRHRNAGRWHRARGVRRRAGRLCARPGPAPPPWRGRPRGRQDDGLGHDQRGGDPRLQARDRQARALARITGR